MAEASGGLPSLVPQPGIVDRPTRHYSGITTPDGSSTYLLWATLLKQACQVMWRQNNKGTSLWLTR